MTYRELQAASWARAGLYMASRLDDGRLVLYDDQGNEVLR